MKSYINEKGFTLVELLAVIVVLAIVMALAVVGISSVLDDFKKNSFVADATSFLHGAHQLVASASNNLFGGDDASYAPNCSSSAGETKYIPISAINLETGGVKSPYGNKYLKGTSTAVNIKDQSYIQVTTAVVKDDANPQKFKCEYTYSIYLTDGVYSIGGINSPVEEKDVNNSKVQLDPEPPKTQGS